MASFPFYPGSPSSCGSASLRAPGPVLAPGPLEREVCRAGSCSSVLCLNSAASLNSGEARAQELAWGSTASGVQRGLSRTQHSSLLVVCVGRPQGEAAAGFILRSQGMERPFCSFTPCAESSSYVSLGGRIGLPTFALLHGTGTPARRGGPKGLLLPCPLP